MSFLNLHNSETKTVKILGEDFQFKSLGSKDYLSLMAMAEAGNIKLMPELTASIIQKNLVGEQLTKEQIIETFSFDELVQISVDLIKAFSEVDELGKP